MVRVEVQAVNLGVRRGDRLLVCGNALPLMESVVDVCGCLSFCLLFLEAAVLLSFHLSSRAHSHSTRADIPFGLYAALETCWCASTVTLSSKYAIYTHTHTQERDVKHISAQGLSLHVLECNEKNRLDCVFLSYVKI